MTFWDRCIIGMLAGILAGALIGAALPAKSAEWNTCQNLAQSVETVVVTATGDNDLIGYIRDRAFSHCLLLDEPPLQIAFQNLIRQVPVTPDPDWQLRCAMEYRSFRPSDGTVVRRGSSARVRCPL